MLDTIIAGKIDPSFVVTHPASLEDASEMYKKFRNKEGVIKVVLRPHGWRPGSKHNLSVSSFLAECA